MLVVDGRRAAHRQVARGRCSTSASRSNRSRCTPTPRSTAGRRAQGGGVQIAVLRTSPSAPAVAAASNGIAQGVMRDTGPTPPKPAFSPALAIQKHGNGPRRRHAARRRGRRAVVDRDPEGLRPAVPRAGRLRRDDAERARRAHLAADGRLGVDVRPDLRGRRPADHLHRRQRRLLRPEQLGGRSRRPRGLGQHGRRLDRRRPAQADQRRRASSTSACCSAASPSTASRSTAATARACDAQGSKFTAFFAVGAVNGPIGGPPAFFLTGIGGGFGINRKLVVPTDLSKFGDYPLIQALDIAAKPQDPMAQLRALGQYFPMDKGTFWFAAGLSLQQLRAGRRHRGRRRAGRRRARHQPARPGAHGAAAAAGGAGLDRGRAAGALLQQRRRAVGAGPAHRQLVAALPRHQAHRRLRLRHLVQGRARAASSCSRSAATTRTSTATATRWCRASGLRWSIGSTHRHQGRQLLRADLRGADGRRRLRGLGQASARPGPR